jgi:hypothetical protein
MKRVLCSLPLALTSFAAFAQATAEAPVEHASMATVVVFGILFVGSCAGAIGYMWWQSKKKKD